MYRVVNAEGTVIDIDVSLYFDAILTELRRGRLSIQRFRQRKWVTIPLRWLMQVPFNVNKHRHNSRQRRVSRSWKRSRNPYHRFDDYSCVTTMSPRREIQSFNRVRERSDGLELL